MLATQLSDEHRHLQAVLRIYDEIFGVRGFAEAQALSASNSDPVSARLYSEFAMYVERLRDDQSQEMFLGAIVAYHLLAEGVIARTAQNLAGDQYVRFGNFPGLLQGQRNVARDEARHIGIGVSYVRRCAAADPTGTYEVVAEVGQPLRRGRRRAARARAGPHGRPRRRRLRRRARGVLRRGDAAAAAAHALYRVRRLALGERQLVAQLDVRDERLHGVA